MLDPSVERRLESNITPTVAAVWVLVKARGRLWGDRYLLGSVGSVSMYSWVSSA